MNFAMNPQESGTHPQMNAWNHLPGISLCCPLGFVGRIKGISSFTVFFSFSFAWFKGAFRNPLLKGFRGLDGGGGSALGIFVVIKTGLLASMATNVVLSSVRLRIFFGTLCTSSSEGF